jgi:hypothetical protein
MEKSKIYDFSYNYDLEKCLIAWISYVTALIRQLIKFLLIFWDKGNHLSFAFARFSIRQKNPTSNVARVQMCYSTNCDLQALCDQCRLFLLIPHILWVPLQIMLFVTPTVASLPCDLGKHGKGKAGMETQPLQQGDISTVPPNIDFGSNRLRQEHHLRLGVQEQPGQDNKALG